MDKFVDFGRRTAQYSGSARRSLISMRTARCSCSTCQGRPPFSIFVQSGHDGVLELWARIRGTVGSSCWPRRRSSQDGRPSLPS